MKIFINAGHGGLDSGAVSKSGIKEKDITKYVSSFLVAMLIEEGFDVEFFQQKKSVNEVVQAEKTSNSNLFISLHCNSFTTTNANGVEVLYYPNSNSGKTLAKICASKISKCMKIKNRGIKERNDLRVLSGTVSPAILIELAFLSNTEEEKLLTFEPYGFANAIKEGIKEWIT